MNTCKTCKHWTLPAANSHKERDLCEPWDIETNKPMERGFAVRICKMPMQTFCEAPVERDGFGLCDGSTYFAALATAEDFGCVKHERTEVA